MLFALYLCAVLSLTFLPFRLDPTAGSYAFDSTLLAIVRGEYTAGSWVLAMMLGNILMLVLLAFWLLCSGSGSGDCGCFLWGWV